MKKLLFTLCTISLWASFFCVSAASSDPNYLSKQELNWLKSHNGQTITIGVNDHMGTSYFNSRWGENGYILTIASLLSKELSLDIKIKSDHSWQSLANDLYADHIDIFFGVNSTQHTRKTLCYTPPIKAYPYTFFARNDDHIFSILDIDQKKLGFLANDSALERFKKSYPKITPKIIEYSDYTELISALETKKIDGFIFASDGLESKFLNKYKDIKKISTLNPIISEMRFVSLKDNQMLINIISKTLKTHKQEVDNAIEQARIDYNYEILKLSKKEINWINSNPHIVFGIIENFLPYESLDDKNFTGILGMYFREFEFITGLKVDYKTNKFHVLFKELKEGDIDIMNLYKTKEREEYFLYTNEFDSEIDWIYGREEAKYVSDIYCLEGKKIAAIKGYWIDKFLNTHLNSANIIYTSSIEESIKLVSHGKADYFIERPTIADFYINSKRYNNIVKKGTTSSDAFLYFAVPNDNPMLHSILMKTMKVIDFDKIKKDGTKEIAPLRTQSENSLIKGLFALIIIILTIAIALYNTIKNLSKKQEETLILKERQKLLYIDALTSLNNRMFFNSLQDEINALPELCIIVLDLNDFKKINDTYGHLFGDHYIILASKIIKETFSDDYTIRMGGDEFCIIIKTNDITYIEHKIKKLRRALNNAKLAEGSIIYTGIDIAAGYQIRNAYQTIDELIVAADKAMYSDKTKAKVSDAPLV